MDLKRLLSICLLCFIALSQLSSAGATNSFESVPDLEQSMYTQLDGFPCVRLLNLSGEIGCSNPGREKVIAPIVKFETGKELVAPSAILVSVDQLENLLSRAAKDLGFAKKVAGVLVESTSQFVSALSGFSPDIKFPLAEFAPYHSNSFEWNPPGSGIMWNAYNFPVFLLSQTSTQILQEVASVNIKSKSAHIEAVAEFDLVMQTTKSATHNSESCLREGACLPLGGYSVWSALPSMNPSPSNAKPSILAITSMDSASFFRDKNLGAESPISGLIALLAVVDALSQVDGLDELNKQLIFVFFTGEAWGYLGSRRFFLESEQKSDSLEGLDLDKIETVMEIGSVGKSFSQDIKTLYAHIAGAASFVNGTLDALHHAQDTLTNESIIVKTASTSNPGVPPSSLMTFLRERPQISGLVLEDFDSTFSNKFYHSHLDDKSNINSSSIVSTASLVARTLYILAGGKEPSSIKVNVSLVEQLIGCLLDCDPGLSCELVQQYISPSSACPSHYVGVILGEPSSTPYPAYVGDISRFLWNFLADKTSVPSKNTSSSCPKDCKGAGEVCIRQESEEKGLCVVSTTRYVPAYSTRLKYESDSGTWKILDSNSSDNTDVWTESNWDKISIRTYKVQTASYGGFVLLLGIIVTLLSYGLISVGRMIIRKALKQD